MICEKCKHEIGPEDLTCPYCGAENPFAQKHRENMQQFGKEYGQTKKEVLKEAGKTKGLALRAAILIVLILGIIAENLIHDANYKDPDPDAEVRRDAEQNAAAYKEEAEGFLQRGEYTEYVSFLYAHELMNFPPEEFTPLRGVTYVASEYYECITAIESMILRPTDPEFHDRLDLDISNFCRRIDSFYEVLEAQEGYEKNAQCLPVMEDMKAELEAAMRTYFALDDAGLEEFLSRSEAQKGVKLEEVLRHE